jgi:hypothetical protein
MTASNSASPWTPARVTLLTDKWNAGESAQAIADALNLDLTLTKHMTRCSVIGKAHRMKLKSHAYQPHAHKDEWPANYSRPPRKPRERHVTVLALSRKAPYRTTPARLPVAQIAPPECKSDPIRFVDVTGARCRFPLTDERPGPDMTVCGSSDMHDHSSYCKFHHRVSWVRNERRA